MSNNVAEVKDVLRAISRKLDRNAIDYTSQHIVMMCYGLQSMTIASDSGDDGDSNELITLLYAMHRMIQNSDAQLSFSQLATALYGFKVQIISVLNKGMNE